MSVPLVEVDDSGKRVQKTPETRRPLPEWRPAETLSRETSSGDRLFVQQRQEIEAKTGVELKSIEKIDSANIEQDIQGYRMAYDKAGADLRDAMNHGASYDRQQYLKSILDAAGNKLEAAQRRLGIIKLEQAKMAA